jgi:threonine dehydratase
LITLANIQEAAERLKDVVVQTPLISSPALDDHVGGKVLIKAENLQRTGSFKIRGAYNMLSQLSAEDAAKGVIAFSSGNHAQAVAAAGTMLGIETTIVMPEDAPRIKIENTRKLGGNTILYDRYNEDREAIARGLAAERNCPVIPAYDHEHIIAGQGTAGLEIVAQCEELGVTPDQVLINCSGGGLTAGVAIAVTSLLPGTKIYPVEPANFDDTTRSLQSGNRETNSADARSICDALQTPTPGELTWSINKDLLSPGIVVTDDEVRDAIRFAFRNLKLVVEPGGSATLAAVLSGKLATAGKVTVIIVSGGNIDVEMFASIQGGT